MSRESTAHAIGGSSMLSVHLVTRGVTADATPGGLLLGATTRATPTAATSAIGLRFHHSTIVDGLSIAEVRSALQDLRQQEDG